MTHLSSSFHPFFIVFLSILSHLQTLFRSIGAFLKITWPHLLDVRLGSRCFCSAAAFGFLRPSSGRDLTTACYALDIKEGCPGSVWRGAHSALVDALLAAKARKRGIGVMMSMDRELYTYNHINMLIQES